MQRDDVLDKLERAKKGDTNITEVMEVLAEFYLSFSKHLKEVKDILRRQDQEIAKLNEKVEILNLVCKNPYERVVLSSDNKEEGEG